MGNDVTKLYEKFGDLDSPYHDFRNEENAEATVSASALLRGSVSSGGLMGGTARIEAHEDVLDMTVMTLLSCGGGVGRTTLISSLATIYAEAGHYVLAVDFDPSNMLSLHLGVASGNPDGLVPRCMGDGRWHEAALSTFSGVHLLPFGRPDIQQLVQFEQMLQADPLWLRHRLAELALPPEAIVLIDVPVLPSPYARQVARAATMVVGVLRPDATAPLMLARMDEWLAGASAPPAEAILLSGFHPSRPLHSAVSGLLRIQLKKRLAPYPIHYDSAVPEALAADLSVVDIAPDSQVAHDLQGLASWLRSRIPGNVGQTVARTVGQTV